MAVAKRAVTNPGVQSDLLKAYQVVLDEVTRDHMANLEALTEQHRAAMDAERRDWETELSRKKEQDLYEFNKAKRDRHDALGQELESRRAAVDTREQAVSDREEAVTAYENEYAALKQKVADIPNLVEAAIQQGYAKGKNEALVQFDTDKRILRAEYEAKAQVAEHKVESLQDRLDKANDTITNLTKQLEQANQRVQDVANSAFLSHGQAKVTVNQAPVK